VSEILFFQFLFILKCDQISYEIGNGDIDDLSKLSFLDEDNIIAELRARYKKGQIYVGFYLCLKILIN
jgi:myosin heavy subunit